MINKLKFFNRLMELSLVAVVRGNSKEEGIEIAKACLKGGMNIIEVTFTTPKAEKVIQDLKVEFKEKMIVGAGTVLDSETARIAILNGAEFIVGPNFNLEVAKLCNRYQIPYMAGCMTINEIIQAMEAGTDIVKLFPGSAFGPNIIKDIKAPIPEVAIMPTGGVSLENMEQWIKNGCIAVGIGSALTKDVENGEFEKTTKVAESFVDKMREIKERLYEK